MGDSERKEKGREGKGREEEGPFIEFTTFVFSSRAFIIRVDASITAMANYSL